MTLTRLACAALALVTLSSVAQGQEAGFTVSTAASSVMQTSQAGPQLNAARAGIELAPSVAAERLAPAPMYKKANVRGRNLMIIGGAAILGGAIVGGDAGNLVALGGLGVGLYGLYIYLN